MGKDRCGPDQTAAHPAVEGVMVQVIKQTESVPFYPDAPSGLSCKAAELDANMIWARIEAYIAHRFSVRSVEWLVEGAAGDQLEVPLGPLVSFTAERFVHGDWSDVELLPAPFGVYLPSDGSFRINARIGSDDVPPLAAEAFRRLAEYLAGGRKTVNEPGASNFGFKVDQLEWSVQRNPAWVAKAMQNSGAADLLRAYRRAP